MNENKYIAHVGDLASGVFHTDLVPPHELDWALMAAMSATKWVDRVKRALFYGTPTPSTTTPCPTSLQHDPKLADLVHGIVGLFSEAGELVELLHGVLTGKTKLDRVNLFEEMGDAHWYLALLHRFTGTTPSQAWDVNISKLKTRYPDKFSEEQAQHENRNLEAEREMLEQLLAEVKHDIAVAEGEH